MATYSKELLSGSTQGKQIRINTTATPGTLIHTAVTGTTDLDEVWLYAVNSDTTARKLTIEWGETNAPDGLIEVTVPAEDGYMLVVPGLLLQNALVIRAFAASSGVIMINGYVNRIDK